MSIHVRTTNPQGLLDAIKAAIAEGEKHPTEEGVITGWTLSDLGSFVHIPDQWPEKLWLRPRVQKGELVFTPIPAKEKTLTPAALGHRQGQFVGMLITHFPTLFDCVMVFP